MINDSAAVLIRAGRKHIINKPVTVRHLALSGSKLQRWSMPKMHLNLFSVAQLLSINQTNSKDLAARNANVRSWPRTYRESSSLLM